MRRRRRTSAAFWALNRLHENWPSPSYRGYSVSAGIDLFYLLRQYAVVTQTHHPRWSEIRGHPRSKVGEDARDAELLCQRDRFNLSRVGSQLSDVCGYCFRRVWQGTKQGADANHHPRRGKARLGPARRLSSRTARSHVHPLPGWRPIVFDDSELCRPTRSSGVLVLRGPSSHVTRSTCP